MAARRRLAPLRMIDLAPQYAALCGELESAALEVMRGGNYVLGPNVEAFEREAAAWLGTRHAVGVASGTDALHLALLASGIGPGDEVVTTPLSFVATAQAIVHTGATVRFADVDPDTYNLDPDTVEAALTPATRAIIPVHLFGLPCDLPRLTALAERHGLLLIEDCAQSIGAAVDGRRTGAIGAAGCFSFYPAKNLGALGDGGLVATDDDDLNERLRTLRGHGGADGTYTEAGFNSRLDEIQAALLRVKLPHLEAFNERRRLIADWYDEALDGQALQRPARPTGLTHVFHHYTVVAEDREEVRGALADRGIDTAVYYGTPLHRQPFLAAQGEPPDLPHADSLAASWLSLPMHPGLGQDDVRRVAAALQEALEIAPGG